jgi:hypothetical protein
MLGFNRQNDSYPSISPRTGRVVSVLPSSVVDRGLVSRSSENKDYKSVLPSSVVDRGLVSQSSENKDYKIGI